MVDTTTPLEVIPEPRTPFGDFIRTVTRPVLTIIGLLAWIMFIESGTNYPPAFEYVVLGMLATWFGERFITRIQGK